MLDSTILQEFAQTFEGEFFYSQTLRLLYATDGSHYREVPLAVAMPKSIKAIQQLVLFAQKHKTSLIPRTAGTSLAGQVVGNGIVVDVSKYFNKILEINTEEKWVKVQPGVVRDELNLFLKPYGYYFGPETSTANRAMIGGMIGNNSCGSNSIVYGSTREHLRAAQVVLADAQICTFEDLNKDQIAQKIAKAEGAEKNIYTQLLTLLQNSENQQEIKNHFPKPNIPRRNTGYALDMLLRNAYFEENHPKQFNLCQLLAGSEGTLCFITEAKLNIVPLPPAHKALVCGHYPSIDNALKANLKALEFSPTASELIDKFVLDCTKENITQRENRFFVQGDPAAILVVEIAKETAAELDTTLEAVQKALIDTQLGYAFPILRGEEMKRVWDLRKAGLGVLGNMKGDAKPTELVEDTAVEVAQLPAYIADFDTLMERLQVKTVHYAHAGTGEIHSKPILNLKTKQGQQLYRTIAEETAKLVKKYGGSLSGEHGDGRLRGEFIPYMVGEKNYALLQEVKRIFDPNNIFNPHKIVNTPKMDTFLRHAPDQPEKQLPTLLRFEESEGYLRLAEKCTGSADCRKSHLIGGTMCPSFMATRNEKDTTRARANILREVLEHSQAQNPFDSQEIYEVMDLCLSCKGCKAECPSNVDVAKLKAEFLHQYYQSNKIPFRTRLITGFNQANQWATLVPSLYNWVVTQKTTARWFKKIAGFAPQRSLPTLHKTTLKKWYQRHYKAPKIPKGKIYLFADEFTNFNDTLVGINTVQLITHLGYEVILLKHEESGRTYLSKGLLKQAQKIAQKNIQLFAPHISPDTPLVGIEPSAILSFRDEYLDLCPTEELRQKAQKIAQNTYLLDEWISKELEKGNITAESFTNETRLIKVHGHCHQKALSSLTATRKALSLMQNYQIQFIPSGCCGMAGSFGYEKEHYDISMQIGELVLFPEVRKQPEEVWICASGTSCRHQIKDGTGKKALHLAEILWQSLKSKQE